MKNILELIKRLHVFLIFLVLQVLALVMVFQNMFYHHAAMVNSGGDLVGSIYSKRAMLADYLRLQEINDDLSLQNSMLRMQLSSNYIYSDTSSVMVDDTIKKQRYRYLTARVVNNSLNREANYITLDKGWSSGVKANMGVISGGSIVGFVTSVSEDFAVAMPVLHRSFQTSIRMKNSMDLGLLRWETSNPELANVEDIPKHVHVEVGDTVLTSGFSSYFPPEITVGYVTEVIDRADENKYHIIIQLSTPFRKLNYVELVENIMLPQQEALEQQAMQENGSDNP
jgi:rod shape-determining protein MreC